MATSCGGDEDKSIGSTLLWREARQERRDRVCDERLAGAIGRAAAWVRLSCGDAAGSGTAVAHSCAARPSGRIGTACRARRAQNLAGWLRRCVSVRVTPQAVSCAACRPLRALAAPRVALPSS